MDKRQRNYYLSIQKVDGTYLIVQPPYTIEFDILRTYYNSDNRVLITIYNLNSITRESIFKGYYDGSLIRTVVLQAGYGTGKSFPQVFAGKVASCWSVRQGNTFATNVEAYDPGNAVSNIIATTPISFQEGTTNDAIVRTLLSLISGIPYNLQQGQIATVPGKIGNPYAVDKPILASIQEICDSQNYFAFIDNQVINILPKNSALASANSTPNTQVINLIDASSGLLGTPTKEGSQLFFEIIFDPKIQVGQQVLLNTTTGNSAYVGQFFVNTVQHKGIISDSKGGQVTTTIGAFFTGFITNGK